LLFFVVALTTSIYYHMDFEIAIPFFNFFAIL
jgi:hypothetical protein